MPEAAQPSRGGRPSRELAQQLRGRILDAASSLFLEQGYASTSVEAIAARAGVSKRTLYHRYADKAELIRAVVVRLIDDETPAPRDLPMEDGDAVTVLRRLGSRLLEAALAPRILALHRLIVAESHRFPELLDAVASTRGREQMVAHLCILLQRLRPDLGDVAVAFAADQFLQLIVSLPQIRALGLGRALSPEQRACWVGDSVELFLHGLAAMQAAGAAPGQSPSQRST